MSHQPPVSEATGRDDEVDLVTSLHPVALGSTAGCVEDATAASILVRSQGYSTHKQKEASQDSMYELRRAFTMPAPSSSSRHSHVARLGLEMLGLEGPISSDLSDLLHRKPADPGRCPEHLARTGFAWTRPAVLSRPKSCRQ